MCRPPIFTTLPTIKEENEYNKTKYKKYERPIAVVTDTKDIFGQCFAIEKLHTMIKNLHLELTSVQTSLLESLSREKILQEEISVLLKVEYEKNQKNNIGKRVVNINSILTSTTV